jgi:hypothetical protein
MTYRALVLFDIDGTLVRRAGPNHREALVHAIRRVTGLESTTDGIPVARDARSERPTATWEETPLSGRCLSHQVLGQRPADYDCGTNSPASGVDKNASAQEASTLDSPGTIRNERPDCGFRSLAVAQPPLILEWAP